MPKFKTDTPVLHSAKGPGKITEVRTEMRAPAAVDLDRLAQEVEKLREKIASDQRALAEQEARLAQGDKPVSVDVYTVTFEGGRTAEFDTFAITKLAARAS